MTESVANIKVKKTFVERLPTWLKNPHSLFYYYWLMVLIGILFFATSLFTNQFTTPFTGDYSAQQISFYTNGYDDWWHFFTTGEFVFYDTNTFLGANNIGSNSFYYLFDPFFMPILLCPRQFIAQGMAFLTILKMAASGMTFYVYIRYMGASRRVSKITGLAYAFSGWTAWYLWFNHFTGIAIVFPLILFGVERILREKKPWVLALSICLMGFVNYFFCFCFVVCAFFYAMFRFFQRIKMFNWKDNCSFLLLGIFGFAMGLLMACFAMIPSAMIALTSSRAETSTYLTSLKDALKSFDLGALFKLLTSWDGLSSSTYLQRDKARGFYILIELMYPVTSDRGVPLVEYANQYGSYDNVAGSLYVFMPIFVLFTPALIWSIRHKRFAPLVATILFIIALISPFFFYALFGFTQPYSRWFLFPVTCMIAFVALYMDYYKEDDLWTLNVGAGVALVLALLAGIFSRHIVDTYGSGTNDYFKERVPIMLVTALMLIHIVGIYCVLRFLKKRPQLHYVYTFVLGVEIVLMGAFIIEGHGVSNYNNVNQGLENNNALHSLIRQTTKKDNTYYRSYSSLAGSSAINDGMRNDYNGSSFFHSLYNYNTDWVRGNQYISTGSWSGVYTEKRIGLDTLLGIKYYYVEDDYFKYYSSSRKATAREDFRYNVPFGYEKITDQYDDNTHLFNVYKNNDYIDFALTYDEIYSTTGNIAVMNSEYLLLNTAITYEDSTIGSHIMDGPLTHVSNPEIKQFGSLSKYLLSTYPDLKQIYNSGEKITYNKLDIKMYGKSDFSDEKYNLTYYDTRSAPSKKSGEVKQAMSLGVDEMITIDDYIYKKSGAPSYPSQLNRDDDYSRYIAVIECPVGKTAEKYSENGMIYYLENDYRDQYKVDIYFVDENNKVITFDNHSDSRFTSSWSSKKHRAFYIAPGADGKAPHVAKIVIVSRNYKLESLYPIYYDTYDNYKARLEEFNTYPVTDVVSKTNTWTFKTNFEKNRIITTRLAYEDGFTVKMTDKNGNTKETPVFMTQGGFVSFVSGVGEQSYELEFYPPGLSLGRTLSAISSFVVISSMVAYAYMSMYLNKKEFPNNLYGFFRLKNKSLREQKRLTID